MLRSDSGVQIAEPRNDGGFAGIGWGASRALPAGRWRSLNGDSPFIPLSGGGADLVLPDYTTGRLVAPTSRPADANPWKVPDYVPPSANGSTSDPSGTGDGSSGNSLIDLFKWAFANNVSGTTADKSGAVVVYGDNAGGAPSGISGTAILILLAIVGVGYLLWKRYV